MNPLETTIKLNPAKKDPQDFRDYDARLLMGESEEKIPRKYSVLDEIQKEDQELKRESQGSSGSCVGQSWSKYVEVLNFFDVRELIDASARFVYSQIYLPTGGAYTRPGAKLIVEDGCSQEQLCPSYPANEKQLRKEPDKTAFENALKYKSKSYARDFNKNDIGFMAQMIYKNHGFVTGAKLSREGWRNGPRVRPPREGEDIGGHSIYCIGYDLKKGHIYFINSWGKEWGDNGIGYFDEEYIQSDDLYNIWTLVDKPNTMNILEQPINERTLELLYQAIHRRKPDELAYEWVGTPLGEFLTKVMDSEEFQQYSRVMKVVKELEKWAEARGEQKQNTSELHPSENNYEFFHSTAATDEDFEFTWEEDPNAGTGKINIDVNY